MGAWFLQLFSASFIISLNCHSVEYRDCFCSQASGVQHTTERGSRRSTIPLCTRQYGLQVTQHFSLDVAGRCREEAVGLWLCLLPNPFQWTKGRHLECRHCSCARPVHQLCKASCVCLTPHMRASCSLTLNAMGRILFDCIICKMSPQRDILYCLWPCHMGEP